MAAIIPGATYKPVVNGYDSRAEQRGLVLHVQAGNGDLFGWFNNPDSEASSEWQVRKDGTILQFLDPDTESGWTQGSGNTHWCAVETEGQPSEALTAAQVEGVAKILAWGHQRYGWPLQLTNDPQGKGFGWHGMGGAAWGGHTGCPGDARRAQMPAILARAIQLSTPNATPATVQEDDMQLNDKITMPDGKTKTVAEALVWTLANVEAIDRKVNAVLATQGVTPDQLKRIESAVSEARVDVTVNGKAV